MGGVTRGTTLSEKGCETAHRDAFPGLEVASNPHSLAIQS